MGQNVFGPSPFWGTFWTILKMRQFGLLYETQMHALGVCIFCLRAPLPLWQPYRRALKTLSPTSSSPHRRAPLHHSTAPFKTLPLVLFPQIAYGLSFLGLRNCGPLAQMWWSMEAIWEEHDGRWDSITTLGDLMSLVPSPVGWTPISPLKQPLLVALNASSSRDPTHRYFLYPLISLCECCWSMWSVLCVHCFLFSYRDWSMWSWFVFCVLYQCALWSCLVWTISTLTILKYPAWTCASSICFVTDQCGWSMCSVFTSLHCFLKELSNIILFEDLTYMTLSWLDLFLTYIALWKIISSMQLKGKNSSNTTFIFQLMIFTTTYKILEFIPLFP